MGYTLTIGNAEVISEEGQYRFCVKAVRLPEAPAAPGDRPDLLRSSKRTPKYGSWYDFTEETGLDGLFYDEDEGLLAHHPGCAALTTEDVSAINDALTKHKAAHPSAVARFVGESGDSSDASTADKTLARLEWLAFWVDWAVKNCERPAMQNS